MLRLALFVLMSAAPFSLFADAYEAEILEKEIWANMRDKKWDAVQARIAKFFQSVHTDGARDKDQEMALIKSLKLGSYDISQMSITEGKDIYIISYMISVGETIDTDKLSKKPTPRLSVWQKINGTWQWISHANLNPIL